MKRYIRVPEVYEGGKPMFVEETDELINATITKLLLTGGQAILSAKLLNVTQLDKPHVIHSSNVKTSMGTIKLTYHSKYNQLIANKVKEFNDEVYY